MVGTAKWRIVQVETARVVDGEPDHLSLGFWDLCAPCSRFLVFPGVRP